MKQKLSKKRRKRVLLALGYNDFQLNQGIWKYCQQSGWILETTMMRYGEIPKFWNGDGIITVLFPNQYELVDYIKESKAKVVNMTADVDCGTHVLLNNYRCGEMVAEHLLDRGFKSLAFLKFTDATDITGRLNGFRDRVAQSNSQFTLIDVTTADTKPGTETQEWLAKQIKRLPKPIGICVQSDNRANILINLCESIDIRVPEEIAVVGVDNNEMVCKSAPVPITSVDSNRELMAYEAAAQLDRLMNGEKAPDSPLIIEPKEIVVRQSSNILSINHAEVAAALNFIWEHFTEQIVVDDVLANSTMSRCGLYRTFEQHVGMSIGAEITHKRIEAAKVLLTNSQRKHYDIAKHCGFSNGEHFSRSFTRVIGQTPTRYRQEHTTH